MSDAQRMMAAAEDIRSAASRVGSVAEEIRQASHNMDGSIESLRMLWERQIYPDLCGLLDRLEALK